MSPPQADTRVDDEAYFSYVEKVNPRRTPLIGKRAISGWKLISESHNMEIKCQIYIVKSVKNRAC